MKETTAISLTSETTGNIYTLSVAPKHPAPTKPLIKRVLLLALTQTLKSALIIVGLTALALFSAVFYLTLTGQAETATAPIVTDVIIGVFYGNVLFFAALTLIIIVTKAFSTYRELTTEQVSIHTTSPAYGHAAPKQTFTPVS